MRALLLFVLALAGCPASPVPDDSPSPLDAPPDDAPRPEPDAPVVPVDCSAVRCLHVREGGTGAGTSWDDALPDLPDDLERGAVYFVADGTYAEHVFDDPEDGTRTITVRKATPAEHGSDVGWSDALGDGQASFDGGLSFARDHYVIDGAVRDEADWMDPSAYGIHADQIYIQNQNLPPGGDHVVVRYLDLGGPYDHAHTPGQGEAVYLGGFDAIITDVTISRCFLHNWSFIQCAGVDGIVVEHTAFAAGWAKEAFRGQSVCRNGILRHNLFFDASQFDPEDPTSGTTADIAIWDGEPGAFDHWDIHGNVIWNDRDIGHCCGVIVVGGDGTSFVGAPANDVHVHNNTIVGLGPSAVAEIRVNGDTDVEVSNNVWYDCDGRTGAIPDTASNGVVTSDPFVDVAGFDFHLATPLPGTSLPAPYDVDPDGTVRGADGVFDRGAFEHVAR